MGGGRIMTSNYCGRSSLPSSESLFQQNAAKPLWRSEDAQGVLCAWAGAALGGDPFTLSNKCPELVAWEV